MVETNLAKANAVWNLAITLAIVALLLSSAFKTWELAEGSYQLATISAKLEKPVSDAKKMREQLNVLATRTIQLANQGDPPAQAIVDMLRQQGVDIPQPK